MKRTIAILCHPSEKASLKGYVITQLATVWREDGHEVFFVLGAGRFVPADVVIVHVDRSVVPDEYLELARQYPIALNAKVKDIRKSTFSTLRVFRGDPHAGRVIVKSELNYAGVPERRSGSSSYAATALRIDSPEDYRIYERVDSVPQAIWDDPGLIVEKFVPEMTDGCYGCYAMNFLGDRYTCGKVVGPNPIVCGRTQQRIDRVPPHPEMLKLREQMGFDYGKFDYVIHDGKPILLDANKTVGAGTLPMTEERVRVRRYRAQGLYAYFDRLSP
jgi:hypothetical protein